MYIATGWWQPQSTSSSSTTRRANRTKKHSLKCKSNAHYITAAKPQNNQTNHDNFHCAIYIYICRCVRTLLRTKYFEARNSSPKPPQNVKGHNLQTQNICSSNSYSSKVQNTSPHILYIWKETAMPYLSICWCSDEIIIYRLKRYNEVNKKIKPKQSTMSKRWKAHTHPHTKISQQACLYV